MPLPHSFTTFNASDASMHLDYTAAITADTRSDGTDHHRTHTDRLLPQPVSASNRHNP